MSSSLEERKETQAVARATPPVSEQAVADVKADIEEIKERTHR